MKKLISILAIAPLAAVFAVFLYTGQASTAAQPNAEDGARQCLFEDSAEAAPAPLCSRCGDGVCVPQCGENELNCPADCAGSSS